MEDDIPQLVTGNESNLNEILSHTKSEGMVVDIRKVQQLNKQFDTSKSTRKVPVTIITGYLGSGKSTLLEQIALKGGRRLAVILNEFGDSSEIEKSLTIRDKEDSYEEWLDLGNGCMCCTVQDSGVKAIEDLISRNDNFDYILLETSGVADPAPIARMFWQDDGIAARTYIDGIVTVLDSEHIVKCLDDVGGHWHGESVSDGDTTTAHLQIAMADTILLNKIDRVDPKDVPAIEQRIRSINSLAPIHETKFGDIDLDKILDLNAFTVVPELNHESSFHDPRISTISIDFEPLGDKQYAQFDKFLQQILWEMEINEKKVEIHRLKGLLLHNDSVHVIQGVRDTYEIYPGTLRGQTCCKLVIIGKDLSMQDTKTELQKWVPGIKFL